MRSIIRRITGHRAASMVALAALLALTAVLVVEWPSSAPGAVQTHVAAPASASATDAGRALRDGWVGGEAETKQRHQTNVPVRGEGRTDKPGDADKTTPGRAVQGEEQRTENRPAKSSSGIPSQSLVPIPKAPQGRETTKGPAHERQATLGEAAGKRPAAKDGKLPEAAKPAPSERRYGAVERGAVKPKDVINAAAGIGGCLAEYGADGQCLPKVPPSFASHVRDMQKAGMDASTMDHHWTCAEVRSYFPAGVAVRQYSEDPQALDRNGDGTACGKND